MKSLLVAGTIVAMAASPGNSQCYIEADLNGVVGDPQPDYVSTTAGQEVPVDVWFLGSPSCACTVIGMYLCEAQHVLGDPGAQYYAPPGGWNFVPAGPPDSSGCITLQGQNFSWIPMVPPWRVATVTYEAAVDQTIAEIALGPGSGLLDLSGLTQYFTNNGDVIARIQIGDVTAAEQASWGSVKALFR